MKALVEELTIGASAERWAEAGFAVADDSTSAGTVRLLFDEAADGIAGWRLQGAAAELDGLPTTLSQPGDIAKTPIAEHPNGTVQIDHVVVFTPDLERTSAAFEAAGIERRRLREVDTGDGQLRQGFFRLGEVILEVVEHSKVEQGPARFWGITFTVADLDVAAELLGEQLGTIRDAVQPGRRIATIRKEAGLGLPVALITPDLA